MRNLFLLIAALWLLPAAPASAKSSSWWDCFFREFELCVGRKSENVAESAGAGKALCDGQARNSCDEEERAKTMQLGGQSANASAAKGKSTSTASTISGGASKPSDVLSVPPTVMVEGRAPSGDNTVLGIDVTLPISEVAAKYKDRNVRGCRPIDDAFARMLCVDSPGGGSPIELEFYRGRLTSLNYEASAGAAVKLRAAALVAEEKTGTKALFTSTFLDPVKQVEVRSRFCLARFPLGGGTLVLHGLPAEDRASEDACSAAAFDSATLSRVEWLPSASVQREIEALRNSDHAPKPKKPGDLEKTKALLPL